MTRATIGINASNPPWPHHVDVSIRLLRVDAPAPLLPVEVTVETREHFHTFLHTHGAEHLADLLWPDGDALDPSSHTRYACRILTGRATMCPECGRNVPEVWRGARSSAWCSCAQGEQA